MKSFALPSAVPAITCRAASVPVHARLAPPVDLHCRNVCVGCPLQS